MRGARFAVLSGLVLVSVGAIAVAAREQTRPGEISPANVWVQNRSPSEAIPVALVDGTFGQVPRVQITGNLAGIDQPIGMRAARQAWEYSQIRIPANQDAAAILDGAGADGWEAIGLDAGTAGGTIVLLKRPR